MDEAALNQALTNPLELSGVARSQVAAVVAKVQRLVAENAEAAAYRPGAVL